MKRREFFAASSAAVFASAARKSWSTPTPCPPKFSLDGRDLGAACVNTPAPTWFTNMANLTWATPVSNTLDSVRPSNAPGSHQAICNAWTGGCADQDRGELLLAANGGHGDYDGNEVYALGLRQASPAWVRLTDPSSPSGGTDAMRSAMNYGDGKPRAVHGYNRCTWGNGRIWYAGIDGVASSGAWSLACYSFNRSNLAWTFHGIPANDSSGSFSWEGGPAAYDRIGNRVWTAAQFGVQDGGYSVDASTGAMTPYNWYLGGNPFGQAWSVIAHDLRLWIVGSITEARLWILDLNNVGAGWKQFNTTGSPNGFVYGSSAVYHQASRAILVWDTSCGASVRKLSIPANPFSNSYTWSTINPASGNSVVPPGPLDSDFRGAFSKFNMIENMGNGQSALVFVGRTTGQTFVFKLPLAV